MASALMAKSAVRPAQVAKASQPRVAQLSARTAVRAMHFHRKISIRTMAAETEEADVAEEVAEVADEKDGPSEWTAGRLAKLAAADNVKAEEASYALNFLWLDKNIAVAVDQVFSRGHRSPVTEYFFWPRKDAWEELKAALEGKDWIGEREKVLLLNRCTEVINYWQDENKHSLGEVQEKFPDCKFQGA